LALRIRRRSCEVQAEGLSLILIKQQKKTMPHALVIAAGSENVGIFEAANMVHFPIESADLAALGVKIQTLYQHFSSEEFERQFRHDDWWQD
jgi:hypothetical protein